MNRTDVGYRNGEYDFIRGVLMFGVTLGHVLTALLYSSDLNPWFYVFIRSYDMPMFAMISGMFLRSSLSRKKWGDVLVNKITTILIPAILWELIFGVIKRDIRFGTSCWFLYAIFFSSIIIILIDGLLKNKHIQMFTMIMIAIMIHCVPDYFHVAFLLIPTMVGYYFSEIKLLGSKGSKNMLYAILFMVWIIMLCFWQGKFSVWYVDGYILDDMKYSIPIVAYRAAIGIIGSFAIMIILKFIYRNITIWRTLILRLETIGRMTLEQYILQCFFVTYLGSALVRKIVERLSYNPFVYNEGFVVFVIGPIIVCMTLILQQCVVAGINRIPMIGKYFFGFKVSKSSDVS